MDAILIGCLIPSVYSAITDALKRDLHDYITIPILAAGIAYSVYSHAWTNIITAIIVFAVLFWMALKGGIAGGDVKFITAIAVWFGYPNILYILLLGSLSAASFGCFKLHKMGLLQKRIGSFFRGVYLRVMFGVKGVMPENKLPGNDEMSEEAIPFGPFFVIAAWVVYIGGIIWI